MSIWTAQSCGNVHALDWLSDLLDESDVYFIHNTLEIIGDYPSEEQPEPWDCHCAIAAAEMVAAAAGKPPADFPAPAKKWLSTNPLELDEELMTLARKAIERIETDTEFKSNWDETDGTDATDATKTRWSMELADLRKRLGL